MIAAGQDFPHLTVGKDHSKKVVEERSVDIWKEYNLITENSTQGTLTKNFWILWRYI